LAFNDEEVGALATQHLIDTGCKRVAHIGGPALSSLLGRLEGYKRALTKNGIAFDPDLVMNTDRAEEMGDVVAYNATQNSSWPESSSRRNLLLQTTWRVRRHRRRSGCGPAHSRRRERHRLRQLAVQQVHTRSP